VVNIGGYEIMDVLASFVAEEHRDHTFHEVMIGLGLLSRFNLVFDYSRQRMFVEPNHTFRESYEFDMSGLIMRPGRGDYLEVVQVYPDSPAERARLQVGDKVTRIDNRLVAEYDTWSLRSLMRQEGKTVSLVVRRGDRERNVSIVLRRLI
jgi:C-terminal processing protease CtpA/Prc